MPHQAILQRQHGYAFYLGRGVLFREGPTGPSIPWMYTHEHDPCAHGNLTGSRLKSRRTRPPTAPVSQSKNSRTHVLHVDAGSFVRITPNKSRSRDRRQGGTGGAERSTGAMERHRICMESDWDSIFYYILNRIRIQIQILSDTNTK